MKRLLSLFTALVLFSCTAWGQLSITAPSTSFTIDFDNTVSGVNNGAFLPSTSIPISTSSPSAGQLNSNAFAFSSTAAIAFSVANGPNGVANGITPNPTATTGWHCFDVDASTSITDRALGVQPTASFATPGSIVLRVQNNTGSTITSLEVSYNALYFNDQGRANTVAFGYSSDNLVYTSVPALTVTSPTTADITPVWTPNVKNTTISSLSVTNGGFFYLRWAFNDSLGSGSRDEFALDDISLTATTGTPSASDGDGTAIARNGGTGALNGKNVFRKGIAQVLETVVTGTAAGDLEKVEIDIPYDFTGLSAGNVTTSGGGGTPSVSVSGNTITVSGLALNNTNPLTVTAAGLSLPTPSDNGLRDVVVRTAIASGTPTAIATTPQIRVAIPASLVRNGTFTSGGPYAFEGIATVGANDASNRVGNFANSTSNRFQFSLQDGSNAVIIDNSNPTFSTVSAGDSVIVLGSISTFQTIQQIVPSTTGDLTVFKTGNPLPSPLVETIAELTGTNNELYEGLLVRVNGVTITGSFPAAGSDGNVTISDGVNSMPMRIDDLTNIDGTATPGGTVDVIGIIGNNSTSNVLYPRSLADIIVSIADGAGSAVATNGGSGALSGSFVFRRGSTNQTLQVVVSGVSAGTLQKVSVTVPSDFGTVTSGDVTISGGATNGDETVSVLSNVITIDNLALTDVNTLTVTVANLSMPTPSSSDNGARPIIVATAVLNSGTPVAFGTSPNVYVTVPISSIRSALDANLLPSAPFASGTTVAVEGVATVSGASIGNFAGSGTNRYQFPLQDATGGIIADNSNINFTPTVSQGNETVILGNISPFNGVTQLTLSSSNVFGIGTASLPAASTQTIPTLTTATTAEALEGSLVRLNAFVSSGTFPAAGSDGNVTISDGTNTMTMRIDDLTDIDGTPTPQGYFNVVGILGQADNSNPRDGNYQLYPRSLADITLDVTETQTVNNSLVTFPVVQVTLNATGAGNLGDVTITNLKGASGIVTVGGSSGIASRWSINPTTQPTGNVTVILTWLSAYDNGRNLASLQVWKSTDGGTSWFPVPGATFNTSTDPRTAQFTVNGFSEFTITDGDNPLPVQLNNFTGISTMRGVELAWDVASEQDNAGFIVFRNGQQIAHYNTTPELRGRGTTSEGKTYRYVDVSGLEVGKSYTYTLRSVDFDGTIHNISRTVVVQVTQAPTVAYTYKLEQNYPNPFNPSTKITFSIKDAGFVSLKVYDLLGREVATLVNERRSAGIYDVNFNAANLGSGVYFYTLTSGGFSQTKKMLFIK